MNDRQKIFVRSTKVCFSACDANDAIVSQNPIMVTRLAAGKALLEKFINADQRVIKIMGGLADHKQLVREKVTMDIELGYDTLRSVAIETNDAVLMKSSHYSPSDLDKMTGIALVEVGKNLETKLSEFSISDLEGHGYSNSDLTELHDNLALFDKALNTPESEIKAHKVDMDDRNQKFNALVVFMKEVMDASAKPFKKKDPYFYNLYRTCRKLHLQGHRKNKSNDENTTPGGFAVKVGMTKIVGIPFKLLENKVYLFSNLGDCNLVYFTQATPDIPTSVPDNNWKIVAGDEATRNSAELGYPDNVYLFVANTSNTQDGEIGIDEIL